MRLGGMMPETIYKIPTIKMRRDRDEWTTRASDNPIMQAVCSGVRLNEGVMRQNEIKSRDRYQRP